MCGARVKLTMPSFATNGEEAAAGAGASCCICAMGTSIRALASGFKGSDVRGGVGADFCVRVGRMTHGANRVAISLDLAVSAEFLRLQ